VSARTSSRALAALVSALLVFSTVSATSAAYAEDAPVVQPTPEAPASVEPTPAPIPSDEPTETPTPTEQPEASDATTTVDLTGLLTNVISENAAAHGDDHEGHEDESTSFDDPVQLFRVIGYGYLVVDVSQVEVGTLALNQLTLRVKVPAGLELSDDYDTRVNELLAASIEAPLVATEIVVDEGPETKALVNQSIMTPAVHKVYAVLVTPGNIAGAPTAPAANQTSAKAQAAIAHASSYWSDQSGGGITFQWKGTTAWYKSTTACTSTAAFWAEAATKATQQLGYRDGFNTHLALFLPSGDASAAACGNVGGRGSVGAGVNTGGTSFNIGTSDSPYELSTLTHELGHNLSFGHSSWAVCSMPTTYPGFLGTNGCAFSEYGDVVDVMGGGGYSANGGSVSSPNAIRSGIWPSSAYTFAASGTTTHTINAVSTNSGKRAVVVEDVDGVNYFVEFRNLTGRDAQFSGANACPIATSGSYSTVCNSGTGVRIMRYEQQSLNGVYFKGARGDNTYLISRTVGGVKRASYTTNESFSSRASGGVTITVNSISGNTATVTVTKPTTKLVKGALGANLTNSYDGSMRVGDTMTAMLGTSWTASSYSFQWYRSGKKISGATKQNYIISSKDKGKLLRVVVKGKVGSKTTSNTAPSLNYGGYGPIRAGVMQPGTVAINSTATPLAAVTADFSSGAKFSYQWYRGSAKISKATKSKYTPTQADRGALIKVVVKATKSGYSSASATSTAKNYTVTASAAVPSISGTAQVGKVLTANDPQTYTTVDGAIPSPTRTWQWYRSGKAISGAKAQQYTLVSADYGKTITVKVSGGRPGFIPSIKTTAATDKVIKGTIAGNYAPPAITKTGTTTVTLSALVAPTSIAELGTTMKYQWYRDGKAITKATKLAYKLTSADYGTMTHVRVTVTKSNYTTVVLTTSALSHSILADPKTPLITGNLRVGQQLTVGAGRLYTNAPSTLSYQWYRDGKAIAGATSSTYTPAVADKGKAFSARIIASKTGFQSSTATSAATPKLGLNNFAPSTILITKTPTSVALTANAQVTEPGTKATYQWYRGAAKISKATKSVYTPTASDAGKVITVRITISKADYTTETRVSAGWNVSVQANGVPALSDSTPAVGNVLGATLPAYSTKDGAFTPASTDVSYQWYASGKAISGAKSATYTVSSKYKGKTISVKVTVKKAGWLTTSTTSVASAKVTAS